MPAMRLLTYHRRSLFFHRGSHVAVVLGVAVGVATLTGALLVGDSVRGSLRQAALGRLGRVDHALVAPRFFRQELADELGVLLAGSNGGQIVCPLIFSTGSATHAGTQRVVHKVTVHGVSEQFWSLDSTPQGVKDTLPLAGDDSRDVILSEALGRELGVKTGDEVILRLGKPSPIAVETLLGRKDDATATLRVTVGGVLPGRGIGDITLSPRQVQSHNAFVRLDLLQRIIGQEGKVNALLVGQRAGQDAGSIELGRVQEEFARRVRLDDLGLRLRANEEHAYIVLESESFLIEPVFEQAAIRSAMEMGVEPVGILTYLANKMTAGSPTNPRVIPYSTISAMEPLGPLAGFVGDASLLPGEIMLNRWAADQLEAVPGDRIDLDYFVSRSFGRLESAQAQFTLRGIVPLEGPAADPGFTPDYPGVTDSKDLADWDPPFPVDLSLVSERDEEYWDQFRTTPKAFISLADGQRLWATEGDRFGRLTSVRIPLQEGQNTDELMTAFGERLLKHIPPAQAGLRFDPVRETALAAGAGATDFGMLFIGFSFFLVISAAMLVALLFRLSLERRSREMGLLLAAGFAPRQVAWLMLLQGTLLAVIGGMVGLAGAIGYGSLMLIGLQSWWSAAVSAPFLTLHVTAGSLSTGFMIGLLVAVASMSWSIRGLTRRSARALLAGAVELRGPVTLRRGKRLPAILAVSAILGTLSLILAALLSNSVTPTTAFFGSGALTLIACLSGLTWRAKRTTRAGVHSAKSPSLIKLALRNATRHLSRSLLTVGLVASAVFVITAMEALRLDADDHEQSIKSGTGGFSFLAESAVPLTYDLNSAQGREELNVTTDAGDLLDHGDVIPFRLRPGDESSCLNLYRPTRPRIIGATEAMIERNGFRFSDTTAESESEKANPWTLLRRTFDDGAVAAIGDEAAVMWQLKSGLGKDIMVTDDSGRAVALRFVALLSGSILQSEIIVAEEAFTRLFPSVNGFGFFLIETPTTATQDLISSLERDLAPYGFDISSPRDRLNAYLAVQNTYLGTFQTLGGLGLLLGTLGLGTVLLRNIHERRAELALMQAVGFAPRSLRRLVLSENMALVLAGLLMGAFSAGVAIAPRIIQRPTEIGWVSLGLTLALVIVVGWISGAAALFIGLRGSLIQSLRRE